jgi:hypothetical protein
MKSLLFLATAASAFPFMAANLPAEERAALLKRTIDESLAKAAVENAVEKRQGLLGGGLLGGGLRKFAQSLALQNWLISKVGGILQPLTGVLAKVDLPTPQPSGLRKVPDSFAGHEYQAPGPTDVRGLCPTLNTLANVS